MGSSVKSVLLLLLLPSVAQHESDTTKKLYPVNAV